jgi:hypothetical protein
MAKVADTLKTNRTRATVSLGCFGLSTQVCRGTVSLVTFVQLGPDGQTITKLFSAPAGNRRPLTIAAGAWSVRTGKTLTLTIGLGAVGKTLLTKFGKVPSSLTITPIYNGYTLAAIARTIDFKP